MATRQDGPIIDPAIAQQFDPLEVQLQSFYSEITAISSKKPDNPINKFKLNFINQTFENVNKVLGDDYLPFPDFRQFDENDLPTASDVVMMLAQYLKCMDRFYSDHTFKKDYDMYWRMSGLKEALAARTKRK
jgi:hypothetical protein